MLHSNGKNHIFSDLVWVVSSDGDLGLYKLVGRTRFFNLVRVLTIGCLTYLGDRMDGVILSKSTLTTRALESVDNSIYLSVLLK